MKDLYPCRWTKGGQNDGRNFRTIRCRTTQDLLLLPANLQGTLYYQGILCYPRRGLVAIQGWRSTGGVLVPPATPMRAFHVVESVHYAGHPELGSHQEHAWKILLMQHGSLGKQNVRSTLQMDSVVQYPQVSATAIKMRSNGFRWALQGSASASSLEWLQALVRPTAGKHLLVRRSRAAGLSPNPSFDLPWSRGLRQGPLGSVWEGSLEWLQALTRPMARKHLLVGRWRTAWLDPSQRRGTGIGKPLSCATTGV